MEVFTEQKAVLVADYFSNNIDKFQNVKKHIPYSHMGATITDAILQAGLNYKHVVYPRVEKLLKKYSDYKTTCDFLILMQAIPLKKLIDWENEIKISRINELSWFLYNNDVNDENQLGTWLNESENVLKLLSIKGIGPKTVDYLKMLAGEQAIPIDRHLFKFLEMVGAAAHSYEEANSIYQNTARILNINHYELDKKIWMFMSGV